MEGCVRSAIIEGHDVPRTFLANLESQRFLCRHLADGLDDSLERTNEGYIEVSIDLSDTPGASRASQNIWDPKKVMYPMRYDLRYVRGPSE
jgi:hypothetical protein